MIYERELNGVQLRYESDTGEIWRLLNVSCQYGMKGDWVKSGQSIASGYQRIWIAGRNMKVSRVGWFIVHGTWPSALLDHVDRDKANDRLENLREATRSQNAMNVPGAKGCTYHKRHKVWQSRIRANGKIIRLGTFRSEQEARAAYKAAVVLYHGEFAPKDVAA